MVAGQGSVDRARQLLEVVQASPKPVVAWWAAGSLSQPGMQVLNNSTVASFRSPDRCAAAVKALVQYYQLTRRADAKSGDAETPDWSVDRSQATQILATANASLSEHESKALLKLYGIPVTMEKVADSAEAAERCAEQIGFPVAMKIDSPDILHKTEANAVRLGVHSGKGVVKAYEEIMAAATRYNPEARINGVVVQEMITGGREVIAGMSQDPQFGPIIAFGLGGIFVEVLKDIALRVIPVSKSEAQKMITEIRGYPILEGTRGNRPADIEALTDLLQKLSRLAEDFKEEIAEIDINPLVVFDQGQGAKALDALVVLNKKG
jgi:acetyltransferase